MKKWVIIVLSILLLLFLTARGIYKAVNSIDDETRWYVNELNFHFTLKVDSIATFNDRGHGFLFCNLITGKMDNSIEHELSQKLHRHKRIRFVSQRTDGRLMLLSRRANKYLVGDSLQVNSSEDLILFYRKGEVIWKESVNNSLLKIVF